MEEFFHQLTNGLAVGGIYALIALGYTMVYGVLRLINFAHGDLFTLGSYLGLTLLFSLGLQGKMSGILVGGALIVMSMGLVAVVGYLLERVAYRPLRGSNRLAAVVSALGASIFFSNAIMLVYGARSQVYPNGILPSVAVSLLGVDIPLMRIVMFVGTVVLMLLLYWFINHTRIGTAIRAVAIDRSVRQTGRRVQRASDGTSLRPLFQGQGRPLLRAASARPPMPRVPGARPLRVPGGVIPPEKHTPWGYGRSRLWTGSERPNPPDAKRAGPCCPPSGRVPARTPHTGGRP